MALEEIDISLDDLFVEDDSGEFALKYSDLFSHI